MEKESKPKVWVEIGVPGSILAQILTHKPEVGYICTSQGLTKSGRNIWENSDTKVKTRYHWGFNLEDGFEPKDKLLVTLESYTVPNLLADQIYQKLIDYSQKNTWDLSESSPSDPLTNLILEEYAKIKEKSPFNSRS